jgi:dihydrofolate reductase
MHDDRFGKKTWKIIPKKGKDRYTQLKKKENVVYF